MSLLRVYAEMFQALGSEPRIQIVRLLLAAYGRGMTVGDIQRQLEMPGATLNHHLEKLRQAGIVESRKDRQWIWYSVRSETLQDMLRFLFAECCTRQTVVPVEAVIGSAAGSGRGKQKAEGGKRKAEGGKQKAESGRPKAEGRRRKADSRKRKAEGQ